MPSKHINNAILKKISKKHPRQVTKYYNKKQIHSLINKKAIKGMKHGIQIGSMSHYKQEVAQPLIHKNLHKPNQSAKPHPDQKQKKVGSRGQSSNAKPLKASHKASKNVEKIGHKKVHIKKG